MNTRRRFSLLMLALVLMLPWGATPLRAQPGRSDPPPDPGWLSFDDYLAGAAPTLALVSEDSRTLHLEAQLPGVQVETVIVDGTPYSHLGGEGYGLGAQLGQPDLPVLRGEVEIPFGAQVTVELVEVAYTEHTLEELGLHTLYPLQPSPIKLPDAPEEPFAYDAALYAQDAPFPAQPVQLEAAYTLRGRRVQPVAIWPVAYNPATGTVRLYSRVELRLHFTGGNALLTEARGRRYTAPAFEERLAAQLLNYTARPAPTSDRGGYLIIVADAYHDAMLPFVALQNSRGFEVTMTRTSEIPGGATTAAIKSYIQDAYDTWSTPPSYLLLVGDTDTIPAWSSTQAGGKYTDLYYATMDGSSDWVPDLARGRFPVRSAAQTTIMVDKVLNYSALTGDEAWLKKAAFIASCDPNFYHVAEGSHNYVIDTHTQPNDYTGIFPGNPQPGGDKIYCNAYSGSATQIRNAANDGRWALIYSGHGGDYSWADGAVSFDQDDVRNLTYAGLFPFVASHACVTGSFFRTESFGETWVLQEDAGALVFWGASHNTYWPEDDLLEKRMFDWLFTRTDAGYPDTAAMTDYGLAQVQLGYPSIARYYWEAYNVLGDPSVKIFMEPEAPDFRLEVTPEAQELCVEETITYTVQIAEVLEYAHPVSLTGGPTPAGVTAQLAPAVVTPPGEAWLTLTAAATATDGPYTHAITGTAESTNVHTATVAYAVNRAPDALALLAPAAGETVSSLAPTFTWEAAPRATHYHLQIARDAAFTQLVFEAEYVPEHQYTLSSALSALQTYYWRVRAHNGCGTSEFSATSTFQTPAWPCILLIDDDGGGSAETAYLTDLETLRATYHIHTVDSATGSGPSARTLAQYPLILWLTGHRYHQTLTAADRAALSGYLDGGGSLLLSSWGAGSDLADTPFLADYLRATHHGDISSGTLPLTGEGPLATHPLTLTAGATAQVSRLMPAGGASALYTLPSPFSEAAAVSYQGDYKLTYLGFGLEGVEDEALRVEALAALLNALGTCPVRAPSAWRYLYLPFVLRN